jgi:hypothetical protein
MLKKYFLLLILIVTTVLSFDLEYTNKHLDKNKTKDISAYVMIRYQNLKFESKQKYGLYEEANNLLILLASNSDKDKDNLLHLIRISKSAVELLDLINKEFKNYI